MKDKKQLDEQKKPARQKRKQGFINDLGKLFVDVSKLIFGGLVIGTIIRLDISHEKMFIVSIISSIFTAIFGLFMARIGKED